MGLTDPETHVRVETARFLDELDPAVHRKLFELALYDPNPKVAEGGEEADERERVCGGLVRRGVPGSR